MGVDVCVCMCGPPPYARAHARAHRFELASIYTVSVRTSFARAAPARAPHVEGLLTISFSYAPLRRSVQAVLEYGLLSASACRLVLRVLRGTARYCAVLLGLSWVTHVVRRGTAWYSGVPPAYPGPTASLPSHAVPTAKCAPAHRPGFCVVLHGTARCCAVLRGTPGYSGVLRGTSGVLRGTSGLPGVRRRTGRRSSRARSAT